jgi:acyl-CoA reductase-like NAD-dependent aldehyde dehydrogenase
MNPSAPAATERSRLDEALARLREAAPRWARAPLPDRIALSRAMADGYERVARRSVAAACAAKGIPLDAPAAGEEWMSGPWATIRMLRQLERSLAAIARKGNTPLGKLGETVDGRLRAQVFPASRFDQVLFLAIRGEVHFEEGAGPRQVEESRARFHRAPDHQGKVCAVLGAGNINSIPPMDVATKLFVEGKVCVLKMNPVNAYLGPLLEEAFADAVARGVLAIVYGGADEGAYLCHHGAVDEVHVTGSERTHDAIVWGPPGPERAARMGRDERLLRKEITSELGNISPVLVVPGPWHTGPLRFQAESVAGMVTHNASYNCNAAKLLVTPRGWRQRGAFLDGVAHFMSFAPPRKAWYPGTEERYRLLTEGRPEVRRAAAPPGAIPWTLVPGLDADAADPAFRTEPFCALLSETTVGSEDPLEYLDRAVAFANERVWGTLAAHVVVHPRTMADPALREAVLRAISGLRYGTVAVNCWAGYGYAFGTTPWGGHPSSTLADIQSGRGFVHNTLMLEHVEKTVVWHPATLFPKPPSFPSHRTAHRLGEKLTELEARPSWRRVPAIAATAMRG